MANVWYVFEGRDPTRGGPNHVVPVGECVGKLGLSKDQLIPKDRLSGPFCTPHFGSSNDSRAPFKEPRHVVVEIEKDEAEAAGWAPGYYHLPLGPKEANARLAGPRSPAR